MKGLGIRTGWVVAIGLLAATSARAQVVHTVNQTDMDFVPANLTIAPGDSVKWMWSSGIHTVTHGDPCTRDSNFLFDAPLDTGHRTFQFQFNTPGVYNYFCEFHCFMGMVGTITVQGACGGNEAVAKTKCTQKNGVNKLVVKLTGAPNDSFTVTLSSGPSKSGTINANGNGKAVFKGAPSGGGTATATFGCGAEASKDYSCP